MYQTDTNKHLGFISLMYSARSVFFRTDPYVCDYSNALKSTKKTISTTKENVLPCIYFYMFVNHVKKPVYASTATLLCDCLSCCNKKWTKGQT